MHINWLGHSCFLLTLSTGKRILMDPYPPLLGEVVYPANIDIITISHNHFDHNYIPDETARTFRECGYFNIEDIIIQGIPSYHDNKLGYKRGNNTIFIIEAENLRICHLGDLGHMLDSSHLDKIGLLDALLIPVGGNYTLNGKEASVLARRIKSRITIPMHYKAPDTNINIKGVEDFLIHMDNIQDIKCSQLNLSTTTSPSPQVILMCSSSVSN